MTNIIKCADRGPPERSALGNLLVYCFQYTQWTQNSNLGNICDVWTEDSDQIKIMMMKWPVLSRCPDSKC